jgi:peptide subunit release factor 1 (eRF1)
MFEPENPVPKYYYRCDKVFHLEDLLNLYIKYDTYAVVLISGKRTDLYVYSKNNINLIKSIECTLPNQHKTGGSSAPRMGRIRDEKINLYVKNIAELMFLKFVKENVFMHLGLVLAGPGELKGEVQNHQMFVQHFQKHLLHIITIPEICDQSINLVKDIILGKNNKNEVMEQFESLVENKDTIDLLVFGGEFVMEQLKLGMLEVLYIDENSMNLVEDFIIDSKTKVMVVEDGLFVRKYGHMVGVRYYVQEVIEEIINED